MTPETSYYVYVRANCGDEDGKSSWSSYKYFTTLATCVKPTGLTANNVTATTATITWTAGEAGQDAWNLQYKRSSDSEWQTVAVTTTSYNLTNLSPVTTYNVRVQADCGDGDLSQWTSSTNFTTECAALTLPYTCDFEGAVETSGHFASYPVPKCWDRIEMQYGNYSPYTYYPYVYDYSSYAHGGTKSLRMYRTPNSANQTIILPAIDDSYDMSNLQIRFWAMAGSSNNTLLVGIMENDNFVQVCTVDGISTTYEEYTALLSEYSGNSRNIAIKCGASSGYSYLYFYIDDVTVEEIPSCFIPTGLAASVNSATETVLTWTAGLSETDWELEVIAEGNSISQSIPVSGATTYTLSTTRATTYTVRVRANCGDGDYSDWSNPINFTSDCGVLTVDDTHPFLEDFEDVDASDFPPICWDKFSHEMSGYTYWYLNSNNGLGSSAAFSYWSEGYAFLVMPKMHINGVATLSFDYLIGSGTYDESCSVVVSTGEMTYNDFNQTIWTADGNNLPSGKASATASLSDFNGQDIYVAFKFKGLGTSGCTWYIDNVSVFVPASQTSTLSQGWNWWTPTVSTDWDALHNALGNNLQTIKSKDGVVTTGDALISGQMYKIRVSADCELTVTGILSSDVSVTIAPGYNWFGYTGAGSLPIATALGSFTPATGDKIVSQNKGFAIFNGNEWEGTLTTLVSGQGYVYVSRDTGSTTLVF